MYLNFMKTWGFFLKSDTKTCILWSNTLFPFQFFLFFFFPCSYCSCCQHFSRSFWYISILTITKQMYCIKKPETWKLVQQLVLHYVKMEKNMWHRYQLVRADITHINSLEIPEAYWSYSCNTASKLYAIVHKTGS